YCASGRVGSRRFNRSPEAETLQGFFVSVLSVRLRPFPLLPRQAVPSFCCRFLSSLPFSPCYPLFPYRSPGRPSEMRLETFSPQRRVILHRNIQMRLKRTKISLERNLFRGTWV
ncbi:hypothetical protein, partial [Phocaeicola sp.]